MDDLDTIEYLKSINFYVFFESLDLIKKYTIHEINKMIFVIIFDKNFSDECNPQYVGFKIVKDSFKRANIFDMMKSIAPSMKILYETNYIIVNKEDFVKLKLFW